MKKFETPVLEIEVFELVDVIATSQDPKPGLTDLDGGWF